MKFFTNDHDLNDLNRYLEQLKQLKDRLGEDVYRFFSTDSFHDSHIYSLRVKNKFNPDTGYEENDPTIIEAHLLHYGGGEYLIRWIGVNKFLMDFDIQRNTYTNSNEIAFEGKRGLDDWMVDEIASTESEYLCHEIALASDTTITIRFNKIEIQKLEVLG